MKRLSFILTALMVGALLLAACGGGGGSQEPTSSAGVGTQPAGGTTGLATGTPTVGAEVSPTAGTTETAVGTAPAGATTGTATAPAGGATAGTPTLASGNNGTGTVASTQYVLLSELLAMPVNDKSGTQVGSVNGVVVNSTSAGASSMDTSSTPAATAAATTDASAAGTTQTPAATAAATVDTSTTGTGTAMSGNPTISFVVVNVTGGASSSSSAGTSSTPAATAAATTDASGAATTQTPAAGSDTSGSAGTASSNQVLVPWQAFAFSGSGMGSVPSASSSSDNSSSSTSANTTQTPAASMADAATTPTLSTDMNSGTTVTSTSGGALTLTVDQSVLAGAPAFDGSAFAGTVAPDVAQYWSGQGLTIPATGVSTTGGTFLLQSPLSGFEVMDKGSQSLGQVQDFVVDTTTGELVYAVLTGSGSSTSSLYVVPINSFTWQAGTGSSTMGQFQANFASDAFSSAPSITSLSDLDLSSADWQSKYDTYWSTVK